MTDRVDLADFDYSLPPESIAQHPTPERDGARLLLLDRAGSALEDARIRDLPARLHPGDLLVVNATRVLPARLRGRKASGGNAEALILGPHGPGTSGSETSGRFRALVRTRGRLREGLKFRFGSEPQALDAELVSVGENGEVELLFAEGRAPYEVGETPLPPYIRRDASASADAERYQTVFAREPGSVAAPTAGLHLSERLLADLDARGIERAEVVLHVGPGTFRPVRAEDLEAGRLHAERFELPAETAAAVERARARGGRVIAVGTTSARVLEARARDDGRVEAGRGETDLFLFPGARFRTVDGLLTNFHLPRSSLLLLVAAFAGRERVLGAYEHAVREGYRFYSYGDAMLIF